MNIIIWILIGAAIVLGLIAAAGWFILPTRAAKLDWFCSFAVASICASLFGLALNCVDILIND